MNKLDFADKVKHAIEVKLTSHGAYVDKELPEYILVMIANKKSKEAMEKDLQLFLGRETSSFIQWLHDYLEKINTDPESKTSDSNSLKSIKVTNKSDRQNKTSEKKKKSDKERSDKDRKDKSKLKLKSKKSDDKKDHKHSESKDHSKTSASRKEKVKTKETPTKIHKEKSDHTKSNRKEKVPEHIEPKSPSLSREIQPIEEKIVDEIVVEKQSPILSSVVKVTQRPRLSQNIPNKDAMKVSVGMMQKDLREATKNMISYEDICQMDSSPIKSSTQLTKSISSPVVTTTSTSASRSSVFTRLGNQQSQIKCNKITLDSDNNDDREEENDIIVSTQPTLSSDDVKMDLRAHLRAKHDERKSIRTLKRHMDDDIDWHDVDSPVRERYDHHEHHQRPQQHRSHIDRKELDDLDDAYRKSRKHKVSKRSRSPNFIVTLKGAEKINLPVSSRLGPKKGPTNSDNSNSSTNVLIRSESGANDGDIEEEIVFNDGYSDDMDCFDNGDNFISINNTQSLVANAVDSSQTPVAPVVAATTVATNPAPVINPATPTETAKDVTKCRFWPGCKNRDTCPFFHPSDLCHVFPNCKFGAACLYIHPKCRFDAMCTKQDCPYLHTAKSNNSYMIPKMTAVQQSQRCAFYPNCTNVNCKYFHPNIPCKFGISCKSKETCMYFHPSVPHKSELKWVANPSGDQSKSVNSITKNSIVSTVTAALDSYGEEENDEVYDKSAVSANHKHHNIVVSATNSTKRTPVELPSVIS